MIQTIKNRVKEAGSRVRVVSVSRLAELREDLDRFEAAEELNGFQRYILHHIYQLDLPEGFEARSVLVAATPAPPYARVEFEYGDRKHRMLGMCRSDADGTGEELSTLLHRLLEEILVPAGYHVADAHRLPLKRLAVRSGLSVYGRNNITYSEGMGSYYTLFAFLTDLPTDPDGDDWTEVRTAEACDGCGVCIASCPTGAIRPERFLIDNERCLTYFNEIPGDIPEWVPRDAFHCLYDCLDCQLGCPMNAPYKDHVAGPFRFDEAETARILDGLHPRDAKPGLARRMRILMMDEFHNVVPRNLRMMFDRQGPELW